MTKYLIFSFLLLVLVGAGCATTYDEDGCASYDDECKSINVCAKAGGAPVFGPGSGYRSCAFPNE